MEKLGAKRKSIIACLGMTISYQSYEVGPEFVARFVAESSGNQQFFSPSINANHAMFDLPAYIMMRLKAADIGIIEDLALCTYADEKRFFSYRRVTHRKEPDYGRHISAIALV
jgi:polyphenol oxidase